MQSVKRLGNVSPIREVNVLRTDNEQAMLKVCKLLHYRGYRFEVYDNSNNHAALPKYSIWISSDIRITVKELELVRAMALGIEKIEKIAGEKNPDITIKNTTGSY